MGTGAESRGRVVRILAVASIVWPLMMAGAVWDRAANGGSVWSFVLYAAGSRICHQRPERSFHTAGVKWPVCGRCSGLYLGAPAGALAAIVMARRRRREMLAALRTHGSFAVVLFRPVWFAVASVPTISQSSRNGQEWSRCPRWLARWPRCRWAPQSRTRSSPSSPGRHDRSSKLAPNEPDVPLDRPRGKSRAGGSRPADESGAGRRIGVDGARRGSFPPGSLSQRHHVLRRPRRDVRDRSRRSAAASFRFNWASRSSSWRPSPSGRSRFRASSPVWRVLAAAMSSASRTSTATPS